MRISDWSSDVCSSDLALLVAVFLAADIGGGAALSLRCATGIFGESAQRGIQQPIAALAAVHLQPVEAEEAMRIALEPQENGRVIGRQFAGEGVPAKGREPGGDGSLSGRADGGS